MNWVSTRFILQWRTVYCTVHWWLRIHNALDVESLYINWPRNCIGTQKNGSFRKYIRKKTRTALRVKRRTRKSPNQIQLNLTLLFILKDWLWTCKEPKVSCTGFCSKTSELHSPTMCTEFNPGWFPRKENCTSRFTNKFGIITEVFRALGKLDPESLYLILPERMHLNSGKPHFQKHNRKTNPERHWMYKAERCIKFSWISSVLCILNDSQSKADQVSCTGFSSKAPELQSAIEWTESQLGSF